MTINQLVFHKIRVVIKFVPQGGIFNKAKPTDAQLDSLKESFQWINDFVK